MYYINPKMCLVAGLCRDLLGQLTAFPRLPSWIKGERERRVKGDEENGKVIVVVALVDERWTLDRKVAGSTPGWDAIKS